MKFLVEGKTEINEAKESRIRKLIKSLHSYGPSSHASLTDDTGNYVQVAGGAATCMIEQY
jgi:hypothetical protein